MRRLREGPFGAQVRPHRDDEQPLAFLGDAVVSSVQDLMNHFVIEAANLPCGVVLFQPRAMGCPLLTLPSYKLWIGEHQLDIAKVSCEGRPSQTSNVLDEYCLWPDRSNGGHQGREHISFVPVTPMFASDGERLARYSARNELNVLRLGSEIEFSHIAMMDWPRAHLLESPPILAKGFTGLIVPFNDR
jgi:hypothetical protein